MLGGAVLGGRRDDGTPGWWDSGTPGRPDAGSGSFFGCGALARKLIIIVYVN